MLNINDLHRKCLPLPLPYIAGGALDFCLLFNIVVVLFLLLFSMWCSLLFLRYDTGMRVQLRWRSSIVFLLLSVARFSLFLEGVVGRMRRLEIGKPTSLLVCVLDQCEFHEFLCCFV